MDYVYNGAIKDAHEPITEPLHVVDAEWDGDAWDDCGTIAGYHRHRAAQSAPCQECRDEWNAYKRRRRAEGPRPKPSFLPDACGTYAGVSRHRRYRVPLCEPCREARNEYRRAGTRKAA